MLDVIGTCMQNFKKIDLKKNPSFFIQSCSALFLLHTVQCTLVEFLCIFLAADQFLILLHKCFPTTRNFSITIFLSLPIVIARSDCIWHLVYIFQLHGQLIRLIYGISNKSQISINTVIGNAAAVEVVDIDLTLVIFSSPELSKDDYISQEQTAKGDEGG